MWDQCLSLLPKGNSKIQGRKQETRHASPPFPGGISKTIAEHDLTCVNDMRVSKPAIITNFNAEPLTMTPGQAPCSHQCIGAAVWTDDSKACAGTFCKSRIETCGCVGKRMPPAQISPCRKSVTQIAFQFSTQLARDKGVMRPIKL